MKQASQEFKESKLREFKDRLCKRLARLLFSLQTRLQPACHSRTTSESLFETFCDENEIPWRKIATTTSKTPDYEIALGCQRVIVEIKELRENASDKQAEASLHNTGVSVTSLTPGDRIRKQISDAGPQLKSFSSGKRPSVVVIYETGFPIRHVSPYQIRVAMFGFDTIVFAVPDNKGASPYPIDRKHGGKRKMTEDHNTSISCVAHLYEANDGKLKLDVYHNHFASRRLKIHREVPRIRHFKLGQKTAGEFTDWVEH